MFRSAFPLSSLKIATKAQVSKKPRDEGANCSETQESAAGPSLVLPMQELDPCIADWRHRFVCFDELQEMHSAKMISGNNCSPIRSDSAFRHGILSGESGRLLSALQVPKPQRLVHRSRHGSKPIGRYHHGPDPVRMACERAQCLAGLQVPEPQRLVPRSRDGAAAVGRYRHGFDQGRMACEREDRLAALQVPEPQRVIPRSRDGTAAGGRHHHGIDAVRMAGERAQCLAGLQVPEPQRSVSRSRDGPEPIGRYHHGIDPGRMAFERAQCLAGLQVPDPQRVVIRSRDGPEPIGRYRHSPRNALARKRLAAPTSRLADRRKSIVASLESTARYKYMCYVVGGERGRNRRNETALLNLGQVS